MNIASRALSPDRLLSGAWQLRQIKVNMPSGVLMLLMGVMLASAVGVIYFKNVERHLTSELQSMQIQAGQLRFETSKLMLERATWRTPRRIQYLAQQRLGMFVPARKTVVALSKTF